MSKKNKTKMLKCQFCKQSTPSGKCSIKNQESREDNCEKAATLLAYAFGNTSNKLKLEDYL